MKTWRWLACVAVMLGATLAGGQVSDDEGSAYAARIRLVLPEGWICTVTTEPGKMGHAHGLGEPAFRIDLRNDTARFPAEHGAISKGNVPSSLRLHFHPIADRASVEATVRAEAVQSREIPVVYAVTDEYIVITSPAWVNHGYYTEKAEAAIRPLRSALAGFFGQAAGRGSDDLSRQLEIILRDATILSANGRTRETVLEFFAEEGGLSTPRQRTYVHQTCPLIKVDITFEPVDAAKESPADKVVSVSRPYLAWSVVD